MSVESALAFATSQTETPVVEAPAPAAGQTDELQSNRLAILAKKESQLQKEREALKKEREEWKAKIDEAEAYRAKGKQFDETRSKDPISALKLIGFTDTEIFNFMSDGEKKDLTPEEIKAQAIEAAREESQKLRDEIKKEKEDAETESNKRLIERLRSDIGSEIKANSEKYEYCAFEGRAAEDQVYEIIVENLKTNKELLSVQDALQIAEDLYEERDKAMATLKKRQPKVETPAEPEKPVRETTISRPPTSNMTAKKAPTLTNDITATSASMQAVINRRETSEEKKKRLIDALKRGAL